MCASRAGLKKNDAVGVLHWQWFTTSRIRSPAAPSPTSRPSTDRGSTRSSGSARPCSATGIQAIDAVHDGFAAALTRPGRRSATTARAGSRPATPAQPPPDDTVRDHVARLPERQRLVLFLRYYADLDYEEIAEAVGIAVGTVGSTLSAAHSALHAALAEEAHND
jgi:hypothetical protein